MKLWRKVLLQALFYFCSFMAIIWLLNMVFSDGIDDWKGEIIKGSLYTVTIIIFNNWKEIKDVAATNQDMPTRRHTKRAFSAKECKNYQIMRVVVQSFSLL